LFKNLKLEIKFVPKENTHLYFAHELLSQINQEQITSIINRNTKPYYFGSVAPDSFYYSAKASVRKISEDLHGRDGRLTNEIVFNLLDEARVKKIEADLAFVFGYLTHCALDIVFHPMIYYLSGNYYDADVKKANEAVYLHRHLETYLDTQVNQTYYFNDYVNFKVLRPLFFPHYISKVYHTTPKEIERTLKRKSRIYSLLRNNLVLDILYIFYRFVKHSSWSKFKLFLGIFYGNLQHDDHIIPKTINYRDVVTGEPKITTIYDLFNEAGAFAVEMIAVAHNYYQGNITREQATEIIRGQSLNTGRVGVPVTDIRYFFDSKYEHHLASLPKSSKVVQ